MLGIIPIPPRRKTPTVFRIPAQGYGGLRGVTLGHRHQAKSPSPHDGGAGRGIKGEGFVSHHPFASMKLLAPNTPICFVKSMRTKTLTSAFRPKPKSSPPDAIRLFALILAHPISGQNCPKTRAISCWAHPPAYE